MVITFLASLLFTPKNSFFFLFFFFSPSAAAGPAALAAFLFAIFFFCTGFGVFAFFTFFSPGDLFALYFSTRISRSKIEVPFNLSASAHDSGWTKRTNATPLQPLSDCTTRMCSISPQHLNASRKIWSVTAEWWKKCPTYC